MNFSKKYEVPNIGIVHAYGVGKNLQDLCDNLNIVDAQDRDVEIQDTLMLEILDDICHATDGAK